MKQSKKMKANAGVISLGDVIQILFHTLPLDHTKVDSKYILAGPHVVVVVLLIVKSNCIHVVL
jgi:hypothetical protein